MMAANYMSLNIEDQLIRLTTALCILGIQLYMGSFFIHVFPGLILFPQFFPPTILNRRTIPLRLCLC